uniref:peptidoglycan lytic exotransglycosylase n=1 Tax=Cyanothece sp. (strain PCC 7425 / ATCC 29141) TaxID=395961 RepID=B8HWW9_CYAP4
MNVLALAFSLGLGLLAATPLPIQTTPLRPVAVSQLSPQLGLDAQLWGKQSDRPRLLAALDYSLQYLQSAEAVKDYQEYTAEGKVGEGFGPALRQRVIQSLQRFRQLVIQSKTPQQLQAAVRREFAFYQAVGKDNAGTVSFTGYYEPVYRASTVPTPDYRYPLYTLPPGFKQWPKPHPTREQLEGQDGLQASAGPLKGLELVWLRDRLEAFLIQVQGSAQLQLTNGKIMTVGYAGKTDYPYTSIGQELIKDGKLKREELTLPRLLQYFKDNPQDLNTYLPRNQSFVFFRNTGGSPATGSLHIPVTPERSIATDKTLMPPGALAVMKTEIPYRNASGQLVKQKVSRYAFDQDTGSAIKGPGRVDIFMGTGQQAKARAGLINGPGQLYYLLLK